MNSNAALRDYVDTVAKSYDLLGDAVIKAGERRARISKQVAAEAISAQREAFQLAGKLAAEPESFLVTSGSTLSEASAAAQKRATSFALSAYQEAVAAGAESRELAEKLAVAGTETAEVAGEVWRAWLSVNPLAEAFAKAFEGSARSA